MPTMSKKLNEVPEIAIMWQAARKSIEEASRILLFGFSMPKSDELLTLMIRDCLARNRHLKLVACIDLDPASVLSRFKRCIPPNTQIDFREFAVAPGTPPDWSVEFRKMGFSFAVPMFVPQRITIRVSRRCPPASSSPVATGATPVAPPAA